MGLGRKNIIAKDNSRNGFNDQRTESLYECEDFKIVKLSSKVITRHSSNHSLDRETPQTDFNMANLIKYTHLLQERIVDCMPVRGLICDRHPIISTSSTIELDKRRSEGPIKLVDK
jgi:hypothetical protein